MKKIIVLVFSVLILFAVSSCGSLKTEKVEGIWALSTVNGATLLRYSAALGTDVAHTAKNLTIKEEKMITATFSGEETAAIEAVVGGFYVLENGVRSVFAAYDSEKDTITINDGEFVCVFVRGEYDLTEFE